MRAIIIILFFLFGKSFAQGNLFINIDSIPSSGLLLDNGWLYAPEINGQKPTISNSSWQAINPSQDLHDSIPKFATQGIGWMRLDFKLASTLNDNNFAIQIQQSIAAEYYLNGKLLDIFGILNENPKLVKAVDPYWRPISFLIKEDTINSLEVRFAVQSGILYTKVFETFNPLTAITLFEHRHSINLYTRLISNYNIFIFLIIGISLMICILHLTFYFVYPSIKANFWFGISRLVYIMGCVSQIVFWLNTKEVGDKIWYGSGAMILFMVMNIFTLLSILLFLDRKLDKIDKAILILFFPLAYSVIFLYGNGWRLAPMFSTIVMLNVLRISILSWKINRINAQVLGFGAVATLVFFAIFILKGNVTNNSFLSTLGIERMIFYFLYTLSLPSAISFLLATDFARTSISLKNQLNEVENLSSINLASEKEKQEILATLNQTLEKQVKARTDELNQSLNTLRSTQAQLIQSEKLASLGELTAGIAHEIQNPLNFVNNFSEVNKELIEELKGERLRVKGERNEKLEEEIFNDLFANLEKINHHGKRADAIVKGMLQHSQSGTGKKEPTDINVLADEYLRLCYHGIRAKEKDFNAIIHTDFDASIGKINIIPQDIGRVILNLLTNAFYAVSEKSKNSSLPAGRLEDPSRGTSGAIGLVTPYQPTVSIFTKKMDEKIEIKVTDNGNGIPQEIIDKIFQPFFTTKPTGQGTGLGLSLAYDIVKAHGGSLTVQSHYCPPGGTITVNTNYVPSEGDINTITNQPPPGGNGSTEGSNFQILLPIQ